MCASLLAFSGDAYKCFSPLGSLNGAFDSQEDICLIYDEAAQCIKRSVIKHGGQCDVDNLHRTLIGYTTSYATYLTPLNLQNCTISKSPSYSNICDDMDRLGLFISITCGRSVLSGFSGNNVPSGYVCSTISSLKICASSFLGYAGRTCDDTDIDIALTSNQTTDWLHEHYPDVNLKQCFSVFTPNENQPSDPQCSQYTFITGSGSTCLSLGGLNASLVEQSTLCKAYFLTLRCLQHVAQESGFHCKVDTIEATLRALHFDYAFHVDSKCHAATPQLGTVFDICHDTTALLHLSALNPYCNPYLAGTSHLNQCSQINSGFVTCGISKLRYAGYSCTSDDLWKALKAPVNQAWMTANFPQINVQGCSQG